MGNAIKTIFTGLFLSWLSPMHACTQTPAAGSSLPVVFVASTPCSAGTRPLPGIPESAGCELIKWKLKLFGGAGAGTYVLDCDYGLPRQGTRGFIQVGQHLHKEGKWVIIKGAGANPAAIVYRFDPDNPPASVSFLRLNENLLHLLDSKQQLMIGTGAWSYTLNRVP